MSQLQEQTKQVVEPIHNEFTNTVVMIRPTNFCCNLETAKNNYYQKLTLDDNGNNTNIDPNQLAQIEFDTYVDELRRNDINVLVIQDPRNDTPDSIFPNNITLFEPKKIYIASVWALNRRLERSIQPIMFQKLQAEPFNFILPTNIIDYAKYESQMNDTQDQQQQDESKMNKYLESTGSLILDQKNKIAFAALSSRCDKELVEQFSIDFGYTPVMFHAYQTIPDPTNDGNDNNNDINNNKPKRGLIYHTNVMLSIAQDFAIICTASIDDENERQHVINVLQNVCKKEIIDISEEQVNNFLGNCLQLQNNQNELIYVMSTTAYNALTIEQKNIITKSSKIVHSKLDVIERLGGGSARCMLLEVFLDKK